jgi:hypothetical protein
MQKHEKTEKVTGSRDDKGKRDFLTESGCRQKAFHHLRRALTYDLDAFVLVSTEALKALRVPTFSI